VYKRNLLILIGIILITYSFSFTQTQWFDSNRKESTVTYTLHHPLHQVESTSKEVTSRIEVDLSNKVIKSVRAIIDVTSFDSGNSNRDSHAMEVIDAINYPDVQFISNFVSTYGDSIKAIGQLTFHGVTKDITIIGKSVWSENQIVISGAFDISLTDFNIERPSLLMIKVDDALKFSVKSVYNFR